MQLTWTYNGPQLSEANWLAYEHTHSKSIGLGYFLLENIFYKIQLDKEVNEVFRKYYRRLSIVHVISLDQGFLALFK